MIRVFKPYHFRNQIIFISPSTQQIFIIIVLIRLFTFTILIKEKRLSCRGLKFFNQGCLQTVRLRIVNNAAEDLV